MKHAFLFGSILFHLFIQQMTKFNGIHFFNIYLSKLKPGQKTPWRITAGKEINGIYRKIKDTENTKDKGKKARETWSYKNLRKNKAWETKRIGTEFL